MIRKRGPNDMDTDNLERQSGENPEPNSQDANGDKEERYTAAEWNEWQEYEEAADYLGTKGKGKHKGGGKSKGKGKGKNNAPTGANGQRDMSAVQCLWCSEYGHFKRDCKKLEQHKKNLDAERAKRGDHTPYVHKPKGPSRPAGSLDDWEEDLVGLTGYDENADALEEFTREDFEDFQMNDDGSDGEDWEDMTCMRCITCPADTIENGECITPERAPTASTVIDKSTPLSELFERKRKKEGIGIMSAEAQEIRLGAQALRAHMAIPKQGFYQCNWEVLSMAESGSESAMTIEENNPYDMFGSAIESALRTDESAESRSQHHDAQWQGLMTKPVERHGWPARRRE